MEKRRVCHEMSTEFVYKNNRIPKAAMQGIYNCK